MGSAGRKRKSNLDPAMTVIAVSVIAFASSVILLVMNSMFMAILGVTGSDLGAWKGYPVLYTFITAETAAALVLAIASAYFLKRGLSAIRYIRADDTNQQKAGTPSGPASADTPDTTGEESRNVVEFLEESERDVYEMILSAGGSILQKNIVNQDRYSRSKVTRILDRLERMGLVDRVRHGSTNLIVVRKRSK